MKIGDLVRYVNEETTTVLGIGVVSNIQRNSVISVLWSNGVESYHSITRLRRLKEST